MKIEEIGGTSIEPTGGLSHLDILVAPMSYLINIAEVPALNSAKVLSTASLAIVLGDHVFKPGFGFTLLRGIQDKNGLESNLIGDQKQAFENKVTVVVEGTDPAVLGARRLYKGKTPLLVLVREAGSGVYRQLGHNKYPATYSEGASKIAPEYEGENSCTFIFMDKNIVEAPVYGGAIVMQADLAVTPKPKPVKP
ncbi:hypothetical protein [Tenacibaculum sp. Bg11-29]|uniref:hypothetical protein n=1 Tax=Tenacibaculum sp. Bg11-29 TaxID=2058306 RepID=UPI0018E2DF7E|nr:hypothetical protein [Tenacibaculum sp. Bg11-29]